MTQGLWAEVEKQVREGKTPIIRVPKVSEVRIPKKDPWRPRKHVDQTLHREQHARLKTQTGWSMQCRNLACKQKLPNNTESICCSRKCEERLRHFCETVLKVLNGEVSIDAFPVEYRNKWLEVFRGEAEQSAAKSRTERKSSRRRADRAA